MCNITSQKIVVYISFLNVFTNILIFDICKVTYNVVFLVSYPFTSIIPPVTFSLKLVYTEHLFLNMH